MSEDIVAMNIYTEGYIDSCSISAGRIDAGHRVLVSTAEMIPGPGFIGS
jgi:hypothetical protein